MSYQYKTIPFIGENQNLLDPNLIANQLNKSINTNSTDGWEFYKINNINIKVEPGCWPALVGVKSFEKRFDMLVFRKLLSHDSNESSLQATNISDSNSRPANENSATLYHSNNFADAIKFLEAKGYSVIKIRKHTNLFITDGKDFKVVKDDNWREYYKEELIEFANTLL